MESKRPVKSVASLYAHQAANEVLAFAEQGLMYASAGLNQRCRLATSFGHLFPMPVAVGSRKVNTRQQVRS